MQLHVEHVRPETAALGLRGHLGLRGKRETRRRRLMSANISPSPLSPEMRVGGGVNIRKKRRGRPEPELRGLRRLDQNPRSAEKATVIRKEGHTSVLPGRADDLIYKAVGLAIRMNVYVRVFHSLPLESHTPKQKTHKSLFPSVRLRREWSRVSETWNPEFSITRESTAAQLLEMASQLLEINLPTLFSL